jgi:AcrR family transcriptional regulator
MDVMSKGQLTREHIVVKAATLFNTHGYAGSSMNDLMAVTGLKKGGIYNHFNNKEEILLEAFDYAFEQVNQAITAVIKSQYTATDKLKAVIQFYRDYALSPVIEGGCPIINATVEADDTNSQLKEKVQAAVQMLIAGLTTVISRGIRRGEFRADLDVERVVVMIISQIEGAVILTRSCQDQKYMDMIADQLLAYIDRELIA